MTQSPHLFYSVWSSGTLFSIYLLSLIQHIHFFALDACLHSHVSFRNMKELKLVSLEDEAAALGTLKPKQLF